MKKVGFSSAGGGGTRRRLGHGRRRRRPAAEPGRGFDADGVGGGRLGAAGRCRCFLVVVEVWFCRRISVEIFCFFGAVVVGRTDSGLAAAARPLQSDLPAAFRRRRGRRRRGSVAAARLWRSTGRRSPPQALDARGAGPGRRRRRHLPFVPVRNEFVFLSFFKLLWNHWRIWKSRGFSFKNKFEHLEGSTLRRSSCGRCRSADRRRRWPS